ncbi:hypothetical protein HMPREF9431_02484, partial [Segatella oulorum F0390]
RAAAFPSVKGTFPTRKGGVSIRKGHVPHPQRRHLHALKCLCIAHNAHLLTMDAPLQGDTAAHRRRPYQPPSNPSATQPFCILLVGKPFATNHSARLFIGKFFAGNLFLCLSVGELFAGNLGTRSHTRNGRGGACVPARTSAQRRFHP